MGSGRRRAQAPRVDCSGWLCSQPGDAIAIEVSGPDKLDFNQRSVTSADGWPDLLQLIQASYSASLQKTESELQQIRRVCTLVARQGETVEYALANRQALARNPKPLNLNSKP